MRKLEEMLNMAESQQVIDEKIQQYEEDVPKDKTLQRVEKANPIYRSVRELEKIAESLPKVKGLGDISDAEFDALSQRATDAYDDLMDLGMNVEARYSGKIFEVAANMLKNAIEAKSAKIEKKLRIIDLQMKRYKLEKTTPNEDNNAVDVSGSGVIVSDRNSLLEKLKKMHKD
jgi:hypothetical protein